MKAPPDTGFPAQGSHRRRRIVDAARILPFAGMFLFLLPVFWGNEAPVRTAWGGIYIFGAWLALIVASAVLSHLLARVAGDDGHGES